MCPLFYPKNKPGHLVWEFLSSETVWLLSFFNANGIKLCVHYFPRGCFPLLICGSFWLYQSDSECSKKPTYSRIIVTDFSHFGMWDLTSLIHNSSKITFEHSAAPLWHLMPQHNICCTMCCWSVTPGTVCISLVFTLLFCQLLCWSLTAAEQSAGLFLNTEDVVPYYSAFIFPIMRWNLTQRKQLENNQREIKV